METKRFLPALFDTVAKSKETVAEACDSLVDLATEGQLLNDVPVLGTSIKILDIKDNFAKNRLKRNCIAFMAAASNATSVEADQIRSRILSDREYSAEFADTMLAVLLESEKPIKCELVGKLLVALARQEITAEEFETLSLVIQAAAVPSLTSLPKFFGLSEGKPFKHSTQSIPQESLLLAAGLATRSGTMFRVSPIGITLFVHGFGGVVVS